MIHGFLKLKFRGGMNIGSAEGLCGEVEKVPGARSELDLFISTLILRTQEWHSIG